MDLTSGTLLPILLQDWKENRFNWAFVAFQRIDCVCPRQRHAPYRMKHTFLLEWDEVEVIECSPLSPYCHLNWAYLGSEGCYLIYGNHHTWERRSLYWEGALNWRRSLYIACLDDWERCSLPEEGMPDINLKNCNSRSPKIFPEIQFNSHYGLWNNILDFSWHFSMQHVIEICHSYLHMFHEIPTLKIMNELFQQAAFKLRVQNVDWVKSRCICEVTHYSCLLVDGMFP